MATFFYELIPVILFFLAFKYYGIYVATVVGIVSTGLQAILSSVQKRTWDKKLWITFGVFVLFGGMTLYFHNPIFVKWKPTVIFWIFALILFISQWVGKTPLMQKLLSHAFQEKSAHVIPSSVWQWLNLAWAFFFLCLGFVNLAIAYRFSDETWVNFKLYGLTGLLLLFSVGQAFYLARYLRDS